MSDGSVLSLDGREVNLRAGLVTLVVIVGVAVVLAFFGTLGLTVGLGTDGCASNNDLDLFAEMDMAAKLHKVKTMDATVMDALTVLRMATINGAKALGMDGITGSLEKGKKADIIVVDINKPHLAPIYNPYSHLVYSVRGSDVSHTIINGRLVMNERKLLIMDIEEVMEKAQVKSKEVLQWVRSNDSLQ